MCGINTDMTPEAMDATVEAMQRRGYAWEDIAWFLMRHPHPDQEDAFVITRAFIANSVNAMLDAQYTQEEIDAWVEGHPVGEVHGYEGLI